MVDQDMEVDDRIDDELINGLNAFESIDDLDEFLAKFQEGSETEATAYTQGEKDVGGTPVTKLPDTIH